MEIQRAFSLQKKKGKSKNSKNINLNQKNETFILFKFLKNLTMFYSIERDA
jgi:hypothetical protein